jgi:hypothetical protein
LVWDGGRVKELQVTIASIATSFFVLVLVLVLVIVIEHFELNASGEKTITITSTSTIGCAKRFLPGQITWVGLTRTALP